MPIVPVFPSGGSGGGGAVLPGSVWLDMPTVLVNAQDVPSPNPGSAQWSQPLNGTGPYAYELTMVSPGQSTAWFDYDIATRTIFYGQGVNSNTDNGKNLLFRVKATDSLGNYGYGYVFFFRGNTSSANVFLMPEIILSQDTVPTPYTFAPVIAGAVGRINDNNLWSHAYGSGTISENPMYLADASAGGGAGISRYMGPFIVDPIAGSIVILTTAQQNATGTVNYMVVQAFRRKRDNSFGVAGPYETLFDYDLQALGAADPSAYTLPLTSSIQNHDCDFVPAPGQTDFFTLRSAQVTAGFAATVEVCSLDANGSTLELSSTLANGRSIRSTVEGLNWPARNNLATRRPNRILTGMLDTEFVWRFHGRMEIAAGGGRVDWVNGQGNGAGAGITLITNTAPAPPSTPTSGLVFVRGYRQSSIVNIGWIQASEILSRDIGVDIVGVGSNRVTYIYQWPGQFPDLEEDRPYDGIKHWVIEGDAEASQETSFGSGGTLKPFSGSSYSNGQAVITEFYHAVFLNSVSNARSFSRLYRTQLLCRPRLMNRNYR